MKTTIALTGCLTFAAAFAQDAAPPAPQPEPAPAPNVESEPAPDPAAVEAARKTIERVADTYRNAPSLIDRITVHLIDPFEMKREQVIEIVLGPGTDAVLDLEYTKVTAVGGRVFVTAPLSPNRYYERPLKTDLETTIQSGPAGFPLPHFVLRRESSVDEIIKALARTVSTGEATLLGQEEVELDGSKFVRINVRGTDGAASVFVDPETNLIERIDPEFNPDSPNAGFSSWIDLNPKVHEQLPTAIAFETEGKLRVDSPDQLEPQPLRVGGELPKLKLPTPDGEELQVADTNGKVLVLVFWSTGWTENDEFLRQMPDFMEWIGREGHRVKVLGVNVIEASARSERRRLVDAYWRAGKYGFPTVIDESDLAQGLYSVEGTPYLLVVRPNGTVEHILRAPDPNLLEKLKFVVGRLSNVLKSAPDAEDPAGDEADAESSTTGESTSDEG